MVSMHSESAISKIFPHIYMLGLDLHMHIRIYYDLTCIRYVCDIHHLKSTRHRVISLGVERFVSSRRGAYSIYNVHARTIIVDR